MDVVQLGVCVCRPLCVCVARLEMDRWDLEESEGGAEESFLSVVVDESPPSHPSYLEFDDFEEDYDDHEEVEAGALVYSLTCSSPGLAR